jgi:hypothetical protein
MNENFLPCGVEKPVLKRNNRLHVLRLMHGTLTCKRKREKETKHSPCGMSHACRLWNNKTSE